MQETIHRVCVKKKREVRKFTIIKRSIYARKQRDVNARAYFFSGSKKLFELVKISKSPEYKLYE